MEPCPKPQWNQKPALSSVMDLRDYLNRSGHLHGSSNRQIHMIVWNMIYMVPWAPTEGRSKPRTGCAGHHFLREQKTWTQFKIMFRIQISRLLCDACDFVKTNSCMTSIPYAVKSSNRFGFVYIITSMEISHNLTHICIHYSQYSLIFLLMITLMNNKSLERKWENWCSCQSCLVNDWVSVLGNPTFISQLKQPHRPSYKGTTLLQSLSS